MPTLDDKVSRELADVDPLEFINHEKGMLIIDEVQKSSAPLPVIKWNACRPEAIRTMGAPENGERFS